MHSMYIIHRHKPYTSWSITKIMSSQQATALQGIASTGCGADIACICSNSKFLGLLQVAIKQSCSPADVQSQHTFLWVLKATC